MTEKTSATASWHVVFGAGGTKAILGGIGAALMFWVAGLTDWGSIGGASGGAIPALLMASRKPPAEFLADVIETEFDTVITPRTGWLGRLLAIMRKYHYEKTRPAKGAWGTTGFLRFVDSKVPKWPRNFWLPAACAHGQVLFTSDGVFKYRWAGKDLLADRGTKIALSPPSPGTAIGASCAMPGILDAVAYDEEYLFDGALAGDGDTPIGVVPRHFGAPRDKVLAVDFGDDAMKQNWLVRTLFHLGCGGYCGSIANRHANQGESGILVYIPIEHFHALQFELSRGAKWKAVIAGFAACVNALAATDLLDEEAKGKVAKFADDLRAIEAANMNDGQLACKVEHYLAEHGLYVPSSCGG